MKRLSFLIHLAVGVVVALGLVTDLVAQEKKAAQAKEQRLSGRVRMISKDTSTITIVRDNVQRQVVYDANTKFTVRNKPGSLDDVKEGVRVICLGTFGEKARFMATRIDVRGQ